MIWVAFFFAGLIEDFIGTLCLKSLIAKRIYLTTILTFVITIVSLAVFYGIFIEIDRNGQRLLAIFVYTMGITLGTYLAMRLKIGGEK